MEEASPRWIKINTDGTPSAEGQLAATGGLVRDKEGRWLGGFMRNIGRDSAFVVKLLGVLMCLKLA